MKPFVIILFFTLTFVVSNCVNQCGNPEVEAFFNTHIDNIESQFQETEIVSGKSMLSVLTLQKITGIESSVNFGDTSVYGTNSEVKLDKENWMSWLDDNICHLSIENLKGVEQDVKAQFPYFIETVQ